MPFINQTQNFPDGLNNLPASAHQNLRDALSMPYPARWHIFFDDFDRYYETDWVLTTTEAGAGNAAELITDEDGGVLLITNDNADDDRDFYQNKGEHFTFVSGKKLYFESRFKISDATQSDFVMGLQVRDTTPLAVSDGVYFQKDDGDTQLDFHVTATTDSAASNISTMGTAYKRYAFYYDGGSTITAYVDDSLVATLGITTMPSTELAVSFGIQNGEAVAKTMSVDYIFVAKER